MNSKSATVRGPHIYRNVNAVWEIEYRWGPSFGDNTHYSVSSGGKTVSLNGFRGNDSFPSGVARQIGEALIAAAEFDGEAVSPE